MKPIDMIAWFTREGLPTPIRFRVEQPYEEPAVVNISRVIDRKEEKLAGNPIIIFTCQSLIQGTEKLYEVHYELRTCRWYVYKM